MDDLEILIQCFRVFFFCKCCLPGFAIQRKGIPVIMNKKLQVFVSSTYTDLMEERQAAVQAILDAGHIPAGMELFKAGNDSQLKTIYKWIDESDVYMLILGGRYGSVEPDSGKSYTQLEYEYALSRDIPVFAVILSQIFLTAKSSASGLTNVTEQAYPDKYKTFRTLVMSKIIREVDDCKDIKIAIHSALNDFMHKYHLTGWVRNTFEKDMLQLLEENRLLKEENESLTKKLQSQANNRLGNYSFDELVAIFRNKIFTFDVNLAKVKKGEKINALDFFMLYYNLFATGVSGSNWLSNEHFFIYNLYAPYYASFQLLEKKIHGNLKHEIFIITPSGSAFYTMLESRGMYTE